MPFVPYDSSFCTIMLKAKWLLTNQWIWKELRTTNRIVWIEFDFLARTTNKIRLNMYLDIGLISSWNFKGRAVCARNQGKQARNPSEQTIALCRFLIFDEISFYQKKLLFYQHLEVLLKEGGYANFCETLITFGDFSQMFYFSSQCCNLIWTNPSKFPG